MNLSLFLIIASTNILHVLELWPAAAARAPSTSVCMVYLAVLLLPTTCLRSLKLLSSFAVVGTVAAAMLVVCTVADFAVWGVLEALGPEVPQGFVESPVFNTGLRTSSDVLGPKVASAFGIVAFCFAGHAIFPSIYISLGPDAKAV